MIIGAAFAPPIVLAFVTWWIIDAREPEPRRWAMRAFGWGMAATFIAGSVNAGVTAWLAPHLPTIPPRALTTVVVAPVVEESLKACSVLLVFLMYRRQFDGVVDGIVYATLTGLGFEVCENLFYHLDAFSRGGMVQLQHVAFLRVVIFQAGHAMVTTFTGLGVGLAACAGSMRRKWMLVATGLGVAIVMHGLHNFLLGFDTTQHPILPLTAVAVAWCGTLVWLLVVRWAIRTEGRCIREELAAEVSSGTLRAEDAVAAGGFTARIRRSFVVYPLWSRTTLRQRALLWRLDELAARLALAKYRLRHAPEDPEFTRMVKEYRQQCRKISQQLDGKRTAAADRRRQTELSTTG